MFIAGKDAFSARESLRKIRQDLTAQLAADTVRRDDVGNREVAVLRNRQLNYPCSKQIVRLHEMALKSKSALADGPSGPAARPARFAAHRRRGAPLGLREPRARLAR